MVGIGGLIIGFIRRPLGGSTNTGRNGTGHGTRHGTGRNLVTRPVPIYYFLPNTHIIFPPINYIHPIQYDLPNQRFYCDLLIAYAHDRSWPLRPFF